MRLTPSDGFLLSLLLPEMLILVNFQATSAKQMTTTTMMNDHQGHNGGEEVVSGTVEFGRDEAVVFPLVNHQPNPTDAIRVTTTEDIRHHLPHLGRLMLSFGQSLPIPLGHLSPFFFSSL